MSEAAWVRNEPSIFPPKPPPTRLTTIEILLLGTPAASDAKTLFGHCVEE